eukprot:PhM_4_TR1189/c0_g1_i1/m.69036
MGCCASSASVVVPSPAQSVSPPTTPAGSPIATTTTTDDTSIAFAQQRTAHRKQSPSETHSARDSPVSAHHHPNYVVHPNDFVNVMSPAAIAAVNSNSTNSIDSSSVIIRYHMPESNHAKIMNNNNNNNNDQNDTSVMSHSNGLTRTTSGSGRTFSFRRKSDGNSLKNILRKGPRLSIANTDDLDDSSIPSDAEGYVRTDSDSGSDDEENGARSSPSTPRRKSVNIRVPEHVATLLQQTPTLVSADFEHQFVFTVVEAVGTDPAVSPTTPAGRKEGTALFHMQTAIDSDNQSAMFEASTSTVCVTSDLIRGYNDDGQKLLNEYAVIGELGRGAYGKVKLAIDTLNDAPCAIKILNRQRLKRAKTSIHDEVAVMKRLRHPNLVKLKAFIDDEDQAKAYLILEYVPCGTLNEDVKATNTPFDVDSFRVKFLACSTDCSTCTTTALSTWTSSQRTSSSGRRASASSRTSASAPSSRTTSRRTRTCSRPCAVRRSSTRQRSLTVIRSTARPRTCGRWASQCSCTCT